jgi:hypothetical protein
MYNPFDKKKAFSMGGDPGYQNPNVPPTYVLDVPANHNQGGMNDAYEAVPSQPAQPNLSGEAQKFLEIESLTRKPNPGAFSLPYYDQFANIASIGARDSRKDANTLFADALAKASRQSGMEDVVSANLSAANSQRGNPLAFRNAQRGIAEGAGKVASNSQVVAAQMAQEAEKMQSQMLQFYLNMGLSLNQAQAAATMDLEKMRNENSQSAASLAYAKQPGGGGSSLWPSIIGAVGAGGAAYLSSKKFGG